MLVNFFINPIDSDLALSNYIPNTLSLLELCIDLYTQQDFGSLLNYFSRSYREDLNSFWIGPHFFFV